MEGTRRRKRKATQTFFDDAQVVGLGLHDAFQALDVARQVLDLGLVEFGGGFGVLFPCWLCFLHRWGRGQGAWMRKRKERVGTFST